ncbi:general transcription factor 3C polypeptide 1-like [Argopecten irradians]|uniref:general transcription factor 3C polypeptide 1-like n=1 Tax=Argopecten irradians TaxID=31199 RepID=UPI003719F8ED
MSRFPDSLFADSAECVHLFEDTFTDPTKYMTFNNITKGGYCACIVAMMSLGIVSFHTQIPRDMIILDPCNIKSWRGYTDPRVNPGKEDKTKKSGASDPNSLVPMETDTTLGATEDAEPSTSTSNKPSTALTPHLLPVEEDYEGAAVKWTSGEVVKVKISNTSCLDLPPQLSMPETQGKPQMTPSRSLITIRRSCASDAENLKHFKFQDNFVISSCNIRMQVKQEEEGTQGKRAVSELMKEVLMSQEEIKRIVHKLTRTLPFELDIDLIWKSVALPLLGPCQQLYNIIDRHGSRGMTRFDLQEMFGGEDWYVTCINLLEEKIAVLKVGVTIERYVSFRNARPWLTHAYKNVKGRGVRQTTQVDDSFDGDLQLMEESFANPLGYLDKVSSETTPSRVTAHTATPSRDTTPTPTAAPSGDTTPTPTAAPSGDTTQTPTRTPSGDTTPTPTPTPSGDTTPTPTAIPSGDTTPTPTPTPSGDMTPTPTPTPSGDTTQDPTTLPSGDAISAHGPLDSIKGNNSELQDLTKKGDNPGIITSNEQNKNDKSGEGNLTSQKVKSDRPKRGKPPSKCQPEDPYIPKPTSTYQRVRLLCSPWRKPEGSFNKPMLKTMIESMMRKIMASPGISFQNLCENYTPFNPPFLKKQILDILEDIKAVRRSILRQESKPSLFSKRVSPKLVTMDKEDDIIVYFPTEICIARLGQFMEYVGQG